MSSAVELVETISWSLPVDVLLLSNVFASQFYLLDSPSIGITIKSIKTESKQTTYSFIFLKPLQNASISRVPLLGQTRKTNKRMHFSFSKINQQLPSLIKLYLQSQNQIHYLQADQ